MLLDTRLDTRTFYYYSTRTRLEVKNHYSQGPDPGTELGGGCRDDAVLDAAEIEAFLGGGRENDCDALDRDDMEDEAEEDEEVLSASTFHGTIQEDLLRLVKEIESKANVKAQQRIVDPVKFLFKTPRVVVTEVRSY